MKIRLLPFCLLISVVASAQTYTYSTLYNFQLTGTGPAYPNALLRDSKGNIYGTSLQGGKYNAGTVFRLTPQGTLTVLHAFNGTTDGSAPNSLTRDTRQGNLYGTTSNKVFKLTLQKNDTYKFSTMFSDSASGLNLGAATIDSKGNLYGTGQACFAFEPCLWEIPAGGVWSALYFDTSFVATATSNVLLDKDGSSYVSFGYGDIAGGGYILEYPSLNTYGSSTLANTINPLRQDSAGNIYGSSYGNAGGCGETCNPGMLFKLTTAGSLSVLYNFCSLANCADGQNPENVTLDSAGNIFGEDSAGVFKFSTTGEESTIYSSDSVAYGPGLLIDTSGNLYGATMAGGNGIGNIWKLTKN